MRGRHVAAKAVDHVTAINAGGDPFPALDGLMALCLPCHSIKTNAVDRPDRSGSGRRFKGHDVDGNPIDRGDAWHRGASNHGKGRGAIPVGSTQKDLVPKSGTDWDGGPWD